MRKEYLNLINDGLDGMVGRLIKINTAEYEIVEIVATGGEKIVVALRNLQTGLVLLAGRIYKAKMGSELYENMKDIAIRGGYIHIFDKINEQNKDTTQPQSFKDLYVETLNLIDVSSGLDFNLGNIVIQRVPKNKKSVLHFIDNYEVYEFGGGLIQIQHILNVSDYPENQDALMNHAAELLHLRDFENLDTLLEKILGDNSNHSTALLLKGCSLCLKGFWADGVNVFQHLISLEPNIEDYYLYFTDVLLLMGKPRYCLQVLTVGLNRYKKNIAIYERLMSIINDWGFIDLFSEYYNSYVEILDPKYANYLVEQHTKSLREFIKFREYFDEGIELQVKQKWEEASEKMTFAMEATKRKSWGLYNLAVCNFHLGHFEKTIELIRQEIFLPNLPELDSYILLLYGLSNQLMNNDNEALTIFEEISDRYSNIYDLPTIPIAFVFVDENQMGGIQTKAIQQIISCLSKIKEKNNENIKIEHLLNLYIECQNKYLSV
ncbi:MAG TPA: hypothetical protein VK175_01255 [Leadbetterella sp.]|nr:hypothetical protein [Leadbetterella sp.]